MPRRGWAWVLLLLSVCLGMFALWPRAHAKAAMAEGEPPLRDADQVCAECHAAIYNRYKQTPMGAGSGAAMAGLIPGEFTQASSGVSYRVFARGGRAWMSYTRAASAGHEALAGEHELLYFVGSGTHGRTYLYKIGDSWFELPVNFYGERHGWGMAPAYDKTAQMPAALPVTQDCLWCHATAVNTPLAQAHNRFATRPFDQGGVGCASCHGDPTAHLAAQGHGPIVNPAKLAPTARDSSCIACHLEGNAVVYKPGRTLAQFHPGDKLEDYATYFVRASERDGGRRASSQYEAMLLSACKRASGDAMTCTSCHDPHSTPAPAERVAFYRAKCLSCHTQPKLASTHHPEQPDCATCHMPRRPTTDITHEQLTDHNIEARPAHTASRPSADEQQLVAVGGWAVGDRDLGLAYAQLAEKSSDRTLAERARSLLARAEAGGASDEQLHMHLGLLEQLGGDNDDASREYAAALRENPYNASALTNRAVLDAATGKAGEAVRLLDRLVEADPSQIDAGLDLAFLECRLGEWEQSQALAARLATYSPDDPTLRAFMQSGVLHGVSCQASRAKR